MLGASLATQTQREVVQALEEDSTVFQYDEVGLPRSWFTIVVKAPTYVAHSCARALATSLSSHRCTTT